jgi:hypothetical protein
VTFGKTIIEAVLECNLPLDSVSGTLITLCTPDSHLRWKYAFSPVIYNIPDLHPLPIWVSFWTDSTLQSQFYILA